MQAGLAKPGTSGMPLTGKFTFLILFIDMGGFPLLQSSPLSAIAVPIFEHCLSLFEVVDLLLLIAIKFIALQNSQVQPP